jgi:hypothetical protein
LKRTSNDIQMKGMAKAGLTMGFARPSQIVTHPGACAETTITDAQPSFLFRFAPPPNRNDAMAMMAAFSDNRIADTGRLQRVKAEAKPVKAREFRVIP